MIKFITYSADNMIISRDRCANSARKYGADIVYEFGRESIDREFYFDNKSILDARFCENGTRPCDGYWLWKPYFINKVMNEAQDGDYVVYVDAGCEIIAPLQSIVDVMDEDLFLFTNGLMHRDWCKMDVMYSILSLDRVPSIYNVKDFLVHRIKGGGLIDIVNFQQVQASALWIKVTPFSRKFIKEWLLFCQMPGMIDDSPSVLPNHPEFAAHRYDQSIITCLAIKYNLTLHFWPDAKWFASQRYRWPGDNYPLMFLHHRQRNNEY